MVKSSAEQQLWKQGQDEAALKKQLRKEWLDHLENTSKGSVTETYRYFQLLIDLQQLPLNTSQKVQLDTRYQRINTPKRNHHWRISLLLMGSVAVLGIMTLNYVIMQTTLIRVQMRGVAIKGVVMVLAKKQQKLLLIKQTNGGLYDMHGNVWEWTCSTNDKKQDTSES